MLRLTFFLLLFFAVTICPVVAEQPEIWISHRSDGKLGSGSKADPYEGGTSERLDRVLRRALDVENMRVHFGPGRFYTKSVLAKDPVSIRKPGVNVLGAGMSRTTLALDPAVNANLPPWTFAVLQADQQIAKDSHLSVQDLTVDTSWPQMKNPRRDVSIGNINLIGSYCSIIRVRALHPHGDNATGKEGFALNIGCGGPYDIHDVLISDCVVRSPRGDYGNAVVIAGWTFNVPVATNATGIVRGCRVYNMRADHKHMAAFAVAGGLVTDCYAENSTVGVYMECARDLTISHCTFLDNTWRGVWIFPANNYGGVQKVKVLNSTIEVSNYIDGAACVEVGSGNEQNATEEALLSGNTLLRKNTKPGGKAHSIITAVGVPSLSIVGNRIEPTLDQSFVRNASTVGNRSLEGGVLQSIPDVVTGDGRTQFLQPPPKPHR